MSESKTLDQARVAARESDAAVVGRAPEYPAFSSGMDAKPGELAGGVVGDIELLKGVALEVTVELGRTRLSIGEVMNLGQGSVIELDKLAGEPVDIRVNGILMASGEVVVLDDVFGVRITRLKERVDRLPAAG